MTPITDSRRFSENKPVLELKSISKRFPTHHAVKEISLELSHGEFFSLLGPSGCGKTTTLRMIAGFEAPTGGEVWLNGARIDHLPPYRRNVNTVFQNYALFPHLTVRGNVEFGLRRRNEGAADVAGRVAKVMEQVQRSGSATSQAGSRGVEGPAAAQRCDVSVRHPRSGGGSIDFGQDRRDERGFGGASWFAAGDLSTAEDEIRCVVLRGDELDRRDRRAAGVHANFEGRPRH
jgi:hypothetical protein